MVGDGPYPTRKYPSKGVLFLPGQPSIVFVTVCTEKRTPWLAQAACHTALGEAWETADAWLVGRYVVMPDHIHLFASPGMKDATIERWVQFWKSLVSRNLAGRAKGWQKGCWHHRLRRGESYEAKWRYVVDNPVRAGLVQDAQEWPFQGELQVLRW